MKKANSSHDNTAANKCTEDDENAVRDNNALLQAYRGIFYTSHSLFLAAGATTLAYSFWATLVLFIMVIIQMVIWYQVISARALIVDYYKYRPLIQAFGITEYEYIHNALKRERANEEISNSAEFKEKFIRFTNWRPTRKAMDIYLPTTLIIVWLVFIIISFQITETAEFINKEVTLPLERRYQTHHRERKDR